jgi:hypothetical protein
LETDRKSDVLIVAKIEATVRQDETPSGLAAGFQYLSGTYCLCEGRQSKFLQNMGLHPPNYMVLQPVSL